MEVVSNMIYFCFVNVLFWFRLLMCASNDFGEILPASTVDIKLIILVSILFLFNLIGLIIQYIKEQTNGKQ